MIARVQRHEGVASRQADHIAGDGKMVPTEMPMPIEDIRDLDAVVCYLGIADSEEDIVSAVKRVEKSAAETAFLEAIAIVKKHEHAAWNRFIGETMTPRSKKFAGHARVCLAACLKELQEALAAKQGEQP